ncbi:hypothetical protein HHI36_009474 [Cryptolaemus montrouzieri]|uniref:DFP2 n=1 Tax=Cryptolaemus montrouzieri TaxID=559131 RepID=A0ABD2MFS8_9CUCU
MLRIHIAILTVIGLANASPGFLDFSDGKIGVNFNGYHASAGLGSEGRLHAQAGTPWGAQAGAGAAGQTAGVNEGRLYAGATAGGGISAAAGLAGGVSGEGSYGGSYAGASSGGKQVEVFKEKSVSAEASGGISAAYKSHVVAPVTKHIQVGVVKKPVQVDVVHEVAVAAPIPVPPPEPKPVTTVIQKTVIPNYEKKIVKVPSYEEKVVRVPTVIEKEVWVPAPPTIIEKEVQVPQPAPPPPPPTVVQTVETYPVVYKTKFRKHPHFLFRKHFSIGGGYGGGYDGGYAGAYTGNVGTTGGGTYAATVTKTANPEFYNDIFNIPVSTLGAVNKFLNGLSSGVSASGSVDVSKSVGVSKSFSAGGAVSAYH